MKDMIMSMRCLSWLVLSSCFQIIFSDHLNVYEPIGQSKSCMSRIKSWYFCQGDEMISTLDGIQQKCNRAIVPGTVLSNLYMDWNSFDPFYGENLKSIPDISDVGKSYYTYWFYGIFAYNDVCGNHTRARLVFRGINYRAEIFLNGQKLFTDDPTTSPSGMFEKYSFEIGQNISNITNVIAVLVHPPDFVGSPANGGQGGDHELARNGAIQQCAAGWDWIQATPDRNTGIWDKVYVEWFGDVGIQDYTMSTTSIDYTSQHADVVAEFTLTRESIEISLDAINGVVLVTVVDGRGKVVASVAEEVSAEQWHAAGKVLPVRVPLRITDVLLWWPHTHGTPHLYNVTILYAIGSLAQQHRSHIVNFRHGVRIIEPFVHSATLGRAFRINGVEIFLLGGNWISTDQFLRYSRGDEASVRRYKQEVFLHKDAGLNLLRVWGGGLTEREEFFDACDELGVLVHQEFWMTGDNNGRWAGNYSWPDDTQSYLRNAKSTILSLRPHASLLLWCAGNELHPEGQNPNTAVATGLQQLLVELDPLRYYVQSSMSPQSSNPALFDVKYALAPQDGPYNILFPSQWYERNPGLSGYSATPISFQPEVGSVSTPVFRSMQRFLSPRSLAADAVPAKNAKVVDAEWDYHKYITYSTGDYDHIYAFGGNSENDKISAEEYSVRAQLVQYTQYRALFEGYLLFQWTYYSAVLMWKTQSPWPTLRGALYDSYLDHTGGYWGARAAMQMGSGAALGLHAQVNPTTLAVSVINRRQRNASSVVVEAQVISLNGEILESDLIDMGPVTANAVVISKNVLERPHNSSPEDVYLYRVAIVRVGDVDIQRQRVSLGNPAALPSLYWLGDPRVEGQDLSQLGHLRSGQAALVSAVSGYSGTAWIGRSNRGCESQSWIPSGVRTDENMVCGAIILSCSQDSPVVAFMMRLTLLRASDDSVSQLDRRVLPTYYSHNYVSLLPGEASEVRFAASLEPTKASAGSPLFSIEVDGWNVPKIEIAV